MVSPDPLPAGNNYELLNALSRGSVTSRIGSTAATLDHCRNPTTGKRHAAIYVTCKVQCWQHFLFGESIK